jgi:Tol biopolymer transport system component
MKNHFVHLFLLVSLSLLVSAAGISPVAGNTAIEYEMSSALLAGTTIRISVGLDGTEANNASCCSSISANGRYIAFESHADNLVSDDTNGTRDVFVLDRQSGHMTRVSVASDGTEGNGWSHRASISADGRYVAFESFASNLVPGDTNGRDDVFVHDRQTGQTTRVSVASDGTQGNGVSATPSISADGRFVVFNSTASNLVAGDTNGTNDVFVHDRQTGQTSLVSVASDGMQGNAGSFAPAISGDGRYVVFHSLASNLVPDDTNGMRDVFFHDRQTGQTSRASVASDGTEGNGSSGGLSISEPPSISFNGRYLAFFSEASNLVPGDTNGKQDIFVHDRQTGQTSRVSVDSHGTQGNGDSFRPSISADGRYVAFHSEASNLITSDTNGMRDVFIYDRQTGQTSRISTASDGTAGNNSSLRPSMSADGRYVAFDSLASTLVPNDTNESWDIFLHERQVEISVMVTPDQEATLDYTDTDGMASTISIPAGAVVSDTLLIYTPIDEVTSPAGLQFAGRAFELSAYQNGGAKPGFNFQQPVNVTLTYSDGAVAGLQEAALALHISDGAGWTDAAETCSPAATYVRDTAANILSVDICHLSQFALMGPQGFSIYLPLVVRPMQP